MQQISPYTTSAFARAVPPPKYLGMPAAGIDISDYAIKFTKLTRHHAGVSLEKHGKVDLPLDTIERGEITDDATLIKLLTRIQDEHHFSYAHISLPEEHAYLFQMELPAGPHAETAQRLEFHLKENVPIGADEAVFDYNVLSTTKEKQQLNVSVYPIAIAQQYIFAFEAAGIRPLSVEIEGQATARALIGADISAPTLVIDIGRNDASLSISQKGTVTFTASLDTGGDDLTRAITRALDISFQEAEKLKREHGFSDTKESEMVYAALLPTVTKFAEMIRKHLMYWQMHMSGDKTQKGEIARVVLAGGNANVRGVAEFLEAKLGVPVEIGSVWQNIPTSKDHVPKIHAEESLEYATAIGLALRSLSRTS